MAFDLFFRRKGRKPSGELPGGRIEVTREADDTIMLSFLGADGEFHWFKFSDDGQVQRLAQNLDAVATRAADQA